MVLALASLVSGLSAALPAVARQDSAGQSVVSVPLFRGEVGDTANVTLGSWGSGAAATSKTSVLSGTNSVQITTEGFYQGGCLTFKDPVDLLPAFQNKDTYIRFQIKFLGTAASQATVDPNSLQQGKQAASPFAKMRYLLVMADGSRYELVRPVDVPPSDDPDAYIPLAFPLAAVTKELPTGKTWGGDGAKLKQIAIFGDRYGQFLIGEINIITDQTEITTGPVDAPLAFANTDTQFVGSAEGGASTLHYSWDFDASDGIQEDAAGRVVRHSFPTTGKGTTTYKVTLTVSDIDGLKKPAVETVDVDVSD